MLDEFRSTNITWDKATSRIYSPVTANASDENGRKLNIQVVNSGQVENLTGATLHLYWETKDKVHYGLDAFDASDISKGEFELFYTRGMLSNVGELNATLVLVDSTGKVVSDWFKITVTRGINEGAIESENSFSSLTQALIDISNLEQNYAPRLNDLTAQLQHIDSELTATTYKLGNLGATSTFKGSDTNANIIAKTGMTIGDEWFDTTNSVSLRWNGATWVSVGNAIKLGNEVVVNSNVKDRTLALEKMDFLTVIRTNIHNPATDTNGYYVSAYGSLVANEAYKVSDYIAVKPKQWLYNDNSLSTGFYGPNKEQRNGLQAGYSNPYQVPDDVFFVRHAYGIAYKGVLCEGKELIDPQADYGDKVVTVSSPFFAEAIKDVVKEEPKDPEEKILLTFGDSITETHTVSQDGLTHTFKKTNWPYYASEKLGMRLINFGKDGAAYKDRPDAGLTFFQHLSNQIDTAIATVQNPKVIVVACGTNDWHFELGDFTTAMNKNSLDSLDRSKLYEAIRWAFWTLKQNYPDALIIAGTPIQRASAHPWDVEPMTTAIKKMANYYNIIIADAMNESGITRQFEVASGTGRYLSDGLHPNEDGKKLLGDYYAKVIRNNS